MSTPENQIYQARLYCEQARLVLAPVPRDLAHHLLDMVIFELRAREARFKAGDALMQPKPRGRSGAEKTAPVSVEARDFPADEQFPPTST
jgi:hypothetical protein